MHTEHDETIRMEQQDSTVSLWRQVERELGIEGRYAISSRIGAGGMGEVFKARQIDIERDVAIKILSVQIEGTAEAAQRFLREAKVLSALEHPHIVRLYHFGMSGSRPYQVVDFLDGISLSTRLEQGPLSLEEFGQIFAQIIDALRYASERGLVHRDIKPGNIFLCRQPDNRIHAVLLDFGIVRQMECKDATLTSTQAVLGSPPYMSPEQCKGSVVDFRSDIYSLGCTMFQSLTGEPPFSADNIIEIMLCHMNSPAPQLTAFIRGKKCDSEIAKIVEHCLAKDPSDRPGSFQELGLKLTEAVESASGDLAFVPPKSRKKATSRIMIGVMSLLLVIPGGFIITQKLRKPEEQGGGIHVSEERLLNDVARWKKQVSISQKKQHRGSLIQTLLDLSTYYRVHHRLSLAEKTSAEALDSARGQPFALCKLYRNESLIYLYQAREEKDPAKKQLLMEKAVTAAETGVKNGENADGFTQLESGAECCELLVELHRIPEAEKQLEHVIKISADMIAGRSELSAAYSREFSAEIQKRSLINTKPFSRSDQLRLSNMFLRIAEVLAEAGMVQEGDNFVHMAREWYEKGASKAAGIDVAKEHDISSRLNKLDELMSVPR